MNHEKSPENTLMLPTEQFAEKPKRAESLFVRARLQSRPAIENPGFSPCDANSDHFLSFSANCEVPENA
jgi:hypothetical protein